MFKLHWLPVHSRIIFKLLLLVYKALNGKAPSYILVSWAIVSALDLYAPVGKNCLLSQWLN